MNITELRLGNYIRYGNPIHKDLPTHKITGILSHSLWLDGSHVSSDNSNVIGVHITEEWLVTKFGFTKRGDTGQFYKGEDTMSISDDGYNFWLGNSGWGKQVKYIHTLQNLYFVLKEEEL